MNSYLKTRTALVILVIVAFALAIHPLSPRDFYQTFRETLRENAAQEGETLIAEAGKLQAARPDKYPSVALSEAAEAGGVELNALTQLPGARDNSEVIGMLRKKAASSIRLGLDLNGGVEFVLDLEPDFAVLSQGSVSRADAEKKLKENFKEYRDLAMEALRKRLEAQNIFETEIAPFGARGLSLKAPLVSKDEKDKLQKLIQMSSKLEFRLVHPKSAEFFAGSRLAALPPTGYEVMREVGDRKAGAPAYLVSKRVELAGSGIDRAFVSQSEFGRMSIALRFNRAGAERFADVTGKNIGRQLAIVLDGRLYCAPVIQTAIVGGQAEITGKFSVEEAKNIADALTNGSFPFKIDVQAVYDTDPTLGKDNVQNGIWAGLLAMVILATFMIVYYHKAGVIAVTALAVNVVLILGAMAAFGATMTMPGIAGIILTLGMAVDANVLVFERMREETELGKNIDSVVTLGFQRAYSAVLDGNLTTLVVAVILIYFGTGAVKGFAVSLSIGIVASLFTALFMTRVIFDWMLKLQRKPKLTMLRFFSKPSIDFIGQARIAVPVSLALIVLSIGACLWRGSDMLSVDFTGGTLLSYRYAQSAPVAALEGTLAESGVAAKVTYKTSAAAADNKKLEVLIRSGNEDKLSIGTGSLQLEVAKSLNQQFPELKLADGQSTAIGGMVGGEMTKNAIWSIAFAFIGMIIYVALRYEFSYAVAGILALVHDVIIALGIFVLMGREMSLPVVAGLLTIIGYSINDTIVIFDRIREEIHLHPERSYVAVVNDSLNRTLSRTILTSLTTFLVVVTMFFFGGIAINDFILVIMLGIIIGSYSSLYIATPIIVFWHKRQQRRHGSHAVAAVEKVKGV